MSYQHAIVDRHQGECQRPDSAQSIDNVLFIATGVGNGSTFRMIPMIFKKEQAGPVLGWTSAIAAYGAYFIPKIFGQQIKNGTPEYALYGFAVYYLSCLVVNWWFYARKNAATPC